ncbi:MAG: N-acetylmuramoyl-L-alanine amidase [Mangrovibacterium sp.]
MDPKTGLLILFLFVTVLLPRQSAAVISSGEPFTVIIDAGHGGRDPGASYKNILEKDIVLRLALKLGRLMEKNIPGTRVVYTRNRDVFIPLHRRVAIANSSKAHLFISLHANYCPIPGISGTETFVMGLPGSGENLDVARKENSVILLEEDYTLRYEGFDPSLPESYIMYEMVRDEYLEQSITIGSLIQQQFSEKAGRRNRGVKQAGFLVLRRIGMPGLLIETGFLSNPEEARYLNSEEGQQAMAKAICKAFETYKNAVETKSEFLLTGIKGKEAVREQKPEIPVIYSVQLAANRNQKDIGSPVFKGLHPVYEIRAGKLYKYFYAREKSYAQICRRLTEARRHFPDAFVVAFHGEKQLSRETWPEH